MPPSAQPLTGYTVMPSPQAAANCSAVTASGTITTAPPAGTLAPSGSAPVAPSSSLSTQPDRSTAASVGLYSSTHSVRVGEAG